MITLMSTERLKLRRIGAKVNLFIIGVVLSVFVLHPLPLIVAVIVDIFYSWFGYLK